MTRIGWSVRVVWLLAAVSTACGESSDSSDGTESSYRAGFSYTITAPDPATPGLDGRTCPATGTFTLGDPPPGPSTPGGLLGHKDGIGIFCLVAAMGSSFYVDVSAASDANTEDTISLQLSSSAISPTTGTSDASVLVIAPPSGILHATSTDPCTVSPVRVLGPGAISADFDCPIMPSFDHGEACAGHGTVEFSGCDSELEN